MSKTSKKRHFHGSGKEKRSPNTSDKAVSKSNNVTTVKSEKNMKADNYANQGKSIGVSANMTPTFVTEINNIKIYGSAKSNLDLVLKNTGSRLSSKDLIINCTGDTFINKPFIKFSPPWFAKEKEIEPVNQMVFDWKDFGTPPEGYDISFWEEILDNCQKNNIERIFVCCMAGKGRTGTTLASLLVADGYAPEDAINFVRTNYTMEAIENKVQELYIMLLYYSNVDEIKEAFTSIISNKHSQANSYNLFNNHDL